MASPSRLFALVLASCSISTAAVAQPDPSIRAIATGVVVAQRTVDIATRRQERIIAVRADRGDAVEAGALLIETDAGELLADLAAAEAELEAARVEREYRGRTADRLEQLARTEAQTQGGADEARMDKTRYDVAMAELRIKLAEARLRKIEALLEDTRLTAPFAGVITERTAEVGQLTEPGAPLLRIEDHSKLELHAPVKELEVTHIKPGDPVLVTVDALEDSPLRGTVGTVIPSGDQEHGFMVEIALPEQAGLYPGMFGKAVFGN